MVPTTLTTSYQPDPHQALQAVKILWDHLTKGLFRYDVSIFCHKEVFWIYSPNNGPLISIQVCMYRRRKALVSLKEIAQY